MQSNGTCLATPPPSPTNRKFRRRCPRHALFGLALASSIALPLTGNALDLSHADYAYRDKLFGKQYSFTPTDRSIMIQFASLREGVSKADIQALVAQYGLTIMHDAIDKHRFAVVTAPADARPDQLVRLLRAVPEVRAVQRALVDQEGFTKYFIPDELTVQFENDATEANMLALIESHDCEIVKDHWTPGYYTLRVPAGSDPFEMIRTFQAQPQVRFAELNVISFNDAMGDVNDNYYSQQWALHNTGSTGGTADADIDAREAWDVETGDPNVLIAIIDTGVDWDHEDLRGNIWQNLGEDADGDGATLEWDGTGWVLDPDDIDGVDDDGNGQIDDLIGWDFDDDDNDPDDDGNHGTACAGIAAAVTDNSTGVAGVAGSCRIMPLKVDLNSGMNANRADAINYAASFVDDYDGVVLSNSWAMSSGDFTAVHSAVINAKAAGAVVCFAAGNSNTTPISYPAIYEQAIAVGATSECDERKSTTSCDGEYWWGSNYGDSLSIAAPGVNIYTTDRTGASGYSASDYISTFNGTSSATPVVAGAAALVISQHIHISPAGSSLTPDEVQEILEFSADAVGGYDYNHDASRPGHSVELGYGRVNINRAMQEVIARAVIDLQPDPVDIALSIDRSGSMSGSKISAAQNAAAQVVRLMNTGDRIAVTSYSSTSSVDYYMTEITSESIKNDAITAIDGLTAGGATSIGGGLGTAQGQFLLASPANYPQSIILMSDGKSNTAPWVESVVPMLPSTTDAYTIGFASSPTDVDADSLQMIAGDTGGEYFFAGADGLAAGMGGNGGANALAAGGVPLIKGYQLSLNRAAGRQQLGLIQQDVSDFYDVTAFFDVDPSIDDVRFSALWELDNTNGTLELIEPGGRIIDPVEAGLDSLIEYLEDVTLMTYTVTKPRTGRWQVRMNGRAGGDDRIYVSASAYTMLKATMSVKNDGLFLPLTIEEHLFENGLPVVGAQVTASISTPRQQNVALPLFDDGQHRDGKPNDGVYANFTMEVVNIPGSYSIETLALGESNLTQVPFKRVCHSAISVAEEVSKMAVFMPHMRAMPKELVMVPVNIGSEAFGRGIDRYSLTLDFDPSILVATGGYRLGGSMSAGWDVQVTPLADRVEVTATGQPLRGAGSLLFLEFEVIGKPGQGSPLDLADVLLADGTVMAATTPGELIVGTSLLHDCPFAVSITSPDTSIVIPEGGGSFQYTLEIDNQTNQLHRRDVWTMLLLPDGSEYGPIVGPAPVTLAPLGSGGRDFGLSVPAYAPGGNYEYVVRSGEYPDASCTEDRLLFTKLP